MDGLRVPETFPSHQPRRQEMTAAPNFRQNLQNEPNWGQCLKFTERGIYAASSSLAKRTLKRAKARAPTLPTTHAVGWPKRPSFCPPTGACPDKYGVLLGSSLVPSQTISPMPAAAGLIDALLHALRRERGEWANSVTNSRLDNPAARIYGRRQ